MLFSVSRISVQSSSYACHIKKSIMARVLHCVSQEIHFDVACFLYDLTNSPSIQEKGDVEDDNP